MINWINSWKQGNKKDNKYNIELRFGRFTLLEIKVCIFCDENCACKRLRFILLNFGFEV